MKLLKRDLKKCEKTKRQHKLFETNAKSGIKSFNRNTSQSSIFVLGVTESKFSVIETDVGIQICCF